MGERAVKRVGAWLALIAMPCITWGLIAVAQDAAGRTSGQFAAEAVVTTGFAALGAVITAYLSLVSVGAALLAPWGGAPSTAFVTRLAPTAWRRITATAVGVTLAGSASLPALAQPDATSPVDWIVHDQVATSPVAAPQEVDAATEVMGLESNLTTEAPAVIESVTPEPAPPAPAPSKPSVAEPAVEPTWEPAPEPVSTGTPSATSHVVARGESLWSITAALLGDTASAAEIAGAWPSLYAANVDVIGDDPGLIYAGQELAIPGELQ